MKTFTKRNVIITLFVVFLFLRLFVSTSSFLMGSDPLKYLEASKRFPLHTLYNDQLYLLHPPFYPYIIHFFDLFVEDHIAGILISLISAAVTFFVLYKFFMMLTKNFNLTFFILVFFTLSVEFIISSRKSLKESFVVMLFFLVIYFYVKGVKFNDKRSIILASIVGCVLAITADHVIFIFPVIVLSYIVFNSKKIDFKKLTFPNIRYLVLPLLVVLLVYGSWMLVKYTQYSQYDYYPNGNSGTPITTKNINLLHLINPSYIEDFAENDPYVKTGLISAIKRYSFNLGYMFNIEPVSIPRGLNFTTMEYLVFPHHFVYMFLVYLPLALVLIYGLFSIFKDIIKTKKIYNNINLYMVGLFLIFVSPITQTITSPRYIFTSYIFFFYFISYGLLALFKKVEIRFHSKFIMLLIPFWYYHNGHFVLFSEKVIPAQNTSDFVNNNLPQNAVIMAQPGYVVKTIYLTGNKVIGLYNSPEKLLELIDYYDVGYIIFGRHSTEYYRYNIKSVDFVRNNPDKFELIATVKEDYSGFYVIEDKSRTDEVYIYKVKNSA